MVSKNIVPDLNLMEMEAGNGFLFSKKVSQFLSITFPVDFLLEEESIPVVLKFK